jgi:lipid II:glycine glycyltransferase (peptidoglycan interpeptide bridge formation enzyme)
MKLEFKEIHDLQTWNDFVLKNQKYTFVQSYEYTKVITSLVSDVKRIGVYYDDKLVGLLPIGIVRARRGSYIRLRHSPVLLNVEESKEIFVEAVKYLETIAAKENLNFIRVQPIISDAGILISNGFKPAPTHNLDAQLTLQLDLKQGEEEIQKNMRKNTRYYIRKAFKEGVEVIKDNSEFESFYKILKETAHRQGYTTWPRGYFENLFKYFNNDQLNLYFAVYKGQKIAIGLFLDFGKYRFYLEGGMNTEFAKQYPAYAIQWISIKESLDKHLEIYDFWGGVAEKDVNGKPLENYPWAGINLFKAGFGGKEIEIVHPHDKIVSNKYWITWLIESIERWKRGY